MDEMPGRMRRSRRLPPEIRVLQIVCAVEDHDGRGGEGGRRRAVRKPGLGEPWRAHRAVQHAAEGGGGAALDRVAHRGDGGHHRSRPQQRGGVLLVVAVQIEADRRRQRGQSGQDPSGQGVAVHRDRDADRLYAGLVVAEVETRICRQQVDVARQPQDRLARLGCHDGLRALHKHAADRRLECLDALADGTGRHVQAAGGRLERALGDGRTESAQLGEIEIHD